VGKKQKKTKSRKQIIEITVNSPGNQCNEYLRRKGRAGVGRICRKGRF